NEGYRASVAPLDPRASAAHPAPGQAEAAARLLALLDGGDLSRPGVARRLQDPLSLRCAAPVLGAGLAALRAARAAVELELAACGDNPLILADEDMVLPNANFDVTHLALAFETLGLALARVAALGAERMAKLMSPGSSELPRFLALRQDGRNGFATVQKTVAALVAEIQHRAMPMPVVVIPVADRVEDYATMATAAVDKAAEIVARLRLLAATELIVAAQAVDLRGNISLGRGTAAVHQAVRAHVPPLDEDRPCAPDIEAVDTMIRDGALAAVLQLVLGTP
ncbi:MAG: aromatic amino acid lyase, partial [Pseudomonadota bacterium]|nr:aromatic amino acid lyase [Pseudomonadota bacterium]